MTGGGDVCRCEDCVKKCALGHLRIAKANSLSSKRGRRFGEKAGVKKRGKDEAEGWGGKRGKVKIQFD